MRCGVKAAGQMWQLTRGQNSAHKKWTGLASKGAADLASSSRDAVTCSLGQAIAHTLRMPGGINRASGIWTGKAQMLPEHVIDSTVS